MYLNEIFWAISYFRETFKWHEDLIERLNPLIFLALNPNDFNSWGSRLELNLSIFTAFQFNYKSGFFHFSL